MEKELVLAAVGMRKLIFQLQNSNPNRKKATDLFQNMSAEGF